MPIGSLPTHSDAAGPARALTADISHRSARGLGIGQGHANWAWPVDGRNGSAGDPTGRDARNGILTLSVFSDKD